MDWFLHISWRSRAHWAVAAVVALAGSLVCSVSGQNAVLTGGTNAFFGSKPVYRIEIELPAGAADSLRHRPREYVKAGVSCDGIQFPEVGLHLKGSTGSFRPFDDKPGFTLEFDRFKTNQFFEGQTKIHLNNSVEDPSSLSEQLGGEYFRAAGIPVPGVSHALVSVNGRSLGLYVLVEGLTPAFFRRHFLRPDGPVFEKDIGPPDGPSDERLVPLEKAAGEADPSKRWQQLASVLDRSRFVTFLAMETAIVHRDGYGAARNNFRLYVDPQSGRAVFLPHGMDQLFGAPDFPLEPQMAGTLAVAVLGSSAGRDAYRQELARLTATISGGTNRVFELAEQLRPHLERGIWKDVWTGAGQLSSRIALRAAWLQAELARPARMPIEFHGLPIPLGADMIQDLSEDHPSSLTVTKSDSSVFLLELNKPGVSSWHTQVMLKRGRYRFEGRARAEALEGLGFGKHSGLALRVFGSVLESKRLNGNSGWESIGVEFEVVEAVQNVQLSAEIRAAKGRAYFVKDSLQLVQLQ